MRVNLPPNFSQEVKKPDTTAPLKYSLCTCCKYAPPHTIGRTTHAHRVTRMSKDLGNLVTP